MNTENLLIFCPSRGSGEIKGIIPMVEIVKSLVLRL